MSNIIFFMDETISSICLGEKNPTNQNQPQTKKQNQPQPRKPQNKTQTPTHDKYNHNTLNFKACEVHMALHF